RSHGEHARVGFSTVPLKVVRGLLVADVMVGPVRAKAIIDTGAQGTVGNLALQNALMSKAPRGTTRTDIMGVTLDVQSGDYLMAPDIDFGGRMKGGGTRITFGARSLCHPVGA